MNMRAENVTAAAKAKILQKCTVRAGAHEPGVMLFVLITDSIAMSVDREKALRKEVE